MIQKYLYCFGGD